MNSATATCLARYLSVAEAADILGTSTAAVREAVRVGVLTGVERDGETVIPVGVVAHAMRDRRRAEREQAIRP